MPRQQIPSLVRGPASSARDVSVDGVEERDDGDNVGEEEVHRRPRPVHQRRDERRENDEGRVQQRRERAVREFEDSGHESAKTDWCFDVRDFIW